MAEPDDVIERNACLVERAGDAQLTVKATVYHIAGAIHAAGGNIIDAHIYTTRDGMGIKFPGTGSARPPVR